MTENGNNENSFNSLDQPDGLVEEAVILTNTLFPDKTTKQSEGNKNWWKRPLRFILVLSLLMLLTLMFSVITSVIGVKEEIHLDNLLEFATDRLKLFTNFSKENEL